ncbi:uncharacterized protein LOC134132170 [Pungitius pungitius]|uniref:uncharacterized protein LOC134132170 n=1 Tax=Pungitius pungitius TaxID=134920 RepID=UPI002E15090C
MFTWLVSGGHVLVSQSHHVCEVLTYGKTQQRDHHFKLTGVARGASHSAGGRGSRSASLLTTHLCLHPHVLNQGETLWTVSLLLPFNHCSLSRMQQLDWSSTFRNTPTPLLRSLHWFPVAAHIQFKTLVLTHHAVNGSGPVYIRDMVKPYIPTRTLRSASAKLLVPPSLREKHSARSRLFAVLAPRWWNELFDDIRTAESL